MEPRIIVTKSNLVQGLRDLGLSQGSNILVHSSLSSFGYVEGGADTVIDALLELISEEGTIMMPAYTYSTRSPDGPAYSLDLPLEKSMGIIPATFRKRAGVERSMNPCFSFLAWGKNASFVLEKQHYLSPVEKLMNLSGQILLIGVKMNRCSAIHLVEEKLAPYIETDKAKIVEHGVEKWVTVRKGLCSTAFIKFEDLLDKSIVCTKIIGKAEVRLFPVSYIFQLATSTFESNPYFFVCGNPDCKSCRVKKGKLDSRY